MPGTIPARFTCLAALCSLLLMFLSPASQAQLNRDPVISDLTTIDQDFMAAQRKTIDDLGRRHFGQGVTGNKQRDLEMMQRLLDRRLVRNEQTLELQAMGIVLGDLLAAEYDLRWVIYEDNEGRSRALKHRDSEVLLFPVTMISRRYEVDSRRPLTEIYAEAEAALLPSLPKKPFE